MSEWMIEQAYSFITTDLTGAVNWDASTRTRVDEAMAAIFSNQLLWPEVWYPPSSSLAATASLGGTGSHRHAVIINILTFGTDLANLDTSNEQP